MTSGPDEAVAARELELVTEASRGDGAAFDRFFTRHAPGVQLLAERLLGPGEVADDVVSEAFEKTVRRLPLLGSRNSSPGIYVLATARNGAYAALGRHRPGAADGPLGALMRLPSRQRELLALREIGLDADRCAEVAGVEPGEVGGQVARARLLLADEPEGTTLSAVFADPRAERLLAAETMRADGAELAAADASAAEALAAEDERFAAALGAVRSSVRTTGQLPAASGSERLAGAARQRAVGAAAGGATGGAAASAAASPAVTPVPTPPPPAEPAGDEYDEVVGDEAAWGIIDEDDFDLEPVEPAPAQSADDEPSAVAPDPAPAPAPVEESAAAPPESGVAPQADDVDEAETEVVSGPGGFAGEIAVPPAAWSAESDWDDEAWGTGEIEAVADGALLASGPVPAIVSDETQAFDAVAAGLADPEPDEELDRTQVIAPFAGSGDGDGGEDDAPRRRRGWIVWLVVALLLFAAAAGVAYVIASGGDDPDPAPTTMTDQPLTTTPADGGSDSDAADETGSADDDPPSERASGTRPESRDSGGSSSSAGGSQSTQGANSGGSTRSSSSDSGGAASSGGGSSGAQAAPEETVEGGESSSGGSVRGDATSTTP